MSKAMSISQIVEAREVLKGTREVIATAEAEYDERAHQVAVHLGSQVLLTDRRGHETRLPEEWLPRDETVRESVASDEVPEAVKEIFQRWVAKVKHGIPALVSRA